MREIKFACPQCGQHIACDRDYADMCIVCPSCSQPMEVPRLSTSEVPHPGACIVASIPTPKQRFSSRIPTIDLWTEKEWEERYQVATTQPQQMPAWLVSAMGTLIVAAVLKVGQASGRTVFLCVIAGTVLSCCLLATRQTITNATPGSSNLGGATSLVLHICLLLLLIPVLALGVLFIGCTVCR